MITIRSLKAAVALIIAAAMLITPLWVSAAESAEFSLTDVQVTKGKLCELTLSAQGSDDLAAFVAELWFDADSLEYLTATVCAENAEFSVNAESGKITVAYFCEEGVDCRKSTGLMTFSFKALSSENSEVSLSVRDAVDTYGKDITVFDEKGSAVTAVTGALSENSDGYSSQGGAVSADAQSSDSSQASSQVFGVSSEAEGDEKQADTLYVPGGKRNSATVISIVIGVLALLSAAVFIAYRAGQESHKRKIKIPIEKNKSVDTETDLE